MQLCGQQQAWVEPAGGQERARQMSGSELSQSFGSQEMKTRSQQFNVAKNKVEVRKPGCQTESGRRS